MDKHILQFILESFDDSEVRSYSGRGMMGKECLGVTTSQRVGDMMAHIVNYLTGAPSDTWSATDGEEVAKALKSMQSDRMGHDSIYYFPSVGFTRSDEGEEETGDNEEDEG